MKPRLFIGSSIESLDVAYAVQEELEHTLTVTVWSQGIFDLSSYTLDTLIASLDKYDGALFVFSPEDEVKLRNATVKAVRDNVLLEFGLFIGRLGRERCFFLIPRGVENFHLPSDLLGLNAATYDPKRPDENLQAALGPACNKIRRQLTSSLKVQGPVKTEEPKQRPASEAPPRQKANAILSPVNEATSGEVVLDYSSYDGRHRIGKPPYEFETKWSKSSDKSIICLNDPDSINGVALAPKNVTLNQIADASHFDYSSRSRRPVVGQVVLWRNTDGYYAATKILDIKDDTRGAPSDEVSFQFWILSDRSSDFTSISKNINQSEEATYSLEKQEGMSFTFDNPTKLSVEEMKKPISRVAMLCDINVNRYEIGPGGKSLQIWIDGPFVLRGNLGQRMSVLLSQNMDVRVIGVIGIVRKFKGASI